MRITERMRFVLVGRIDIRPHSHLLRLHIIHQKESIMKTILRILFYILVTEHHILVITFLTSPLWAFNVLPVHLAILVILMLIWRLTSHYPCPLTTLENKLRTALGMPRISKFFRHYYIKRYVKLKHYMCSFYWNARG